MTPRENFIPSVRNPRLTQRLLLRVLQHPGGWLHYDYFWKVYFSKVIFSKVKVYFTRVYFLRKKYFKKWRDPRRRHAGEGSSDGMSGGPKSRVFKIWSNTSYMAGDNLFSIFSQGLSSFSRSQGSRSNVSWWRNKIQKFSHLRQN